MLTRDSVALTAQDDSIKGSLHCLLSHRLKPRKGRFDLWKVYVQVHITRTGVTMSRQQLHRNVAVSAGVSYSLKVVNNGNRPWTIFVYQQPPPDAYGAESLAWLTSPYNINNGGDQFTFTWSIDYQVMWAQTGTLIPGVIFSASGKRDADLTTNNLSNFSIINHTPTLSDPTRGGAPDSLTINDGPTVPPVQYSVGVGMGSKGVYAVNAGPNLQHVFTPNPIYWVCAIDHVIEGQVMDITTITQNDKVVFPTNVFSMTATLQGDNTWDIQPS